MSARFLVGTSGWTYNDWKGLFYPEKLAKTRWFQYYTGVFPTVEINATFYRFFADSTYEKWRDTSPPGFRFVLKAPRLITHLKKLVNVEEDVRSFWRSASILGEKLGLVLLQVAPQTSYKPELLRKAILAFEAPGKVAVEFRNEAWRNEDVLALLREVGSAYVSVDSPIERPVDWVTGEVGYIRVHGRDKWYLYDYSEAELGEIAGVAKRMEEQGAEEVYIFFNNDYHANAPRNALRLTEMLKE